jgi:phosphoribosylformylglycinamidine synthase subunit PurQ / glutaminase
MTTAIILFPGINRERDMAKAVERASGQKPLIVWHGESELPKVDLVIVPGGFSYGDYLRCGAIAARSPIMSAIIREAEKGLPVMGICNGFQILTEARLLSGALVRNRDLKFICKDVHLRVENTNTRFTRRYAPGQVIRVPVAHGEGNYIADDETLKRIEGEGQVLFRYCDAGGALSETSNVNGSMNAIAGVMNAAGNVMGMMPHPEDLIDPLLGGTDGSGLFESVLERAA